MAAAIEITQFASVQQRIQPVFFRYYCSCQLLSHHYLERKKTHKVAINTHDQQRTTMHHKENADETEIGPRPRSYFRPVRLKLNEDDKQCEQYE